jgi:glycerol kinase
MGEYILSIDQGTTGTTVIVLGRDLRVRARVNREFGQIYPRPGWVEHDPEEIWFSVRQTVSQAVAEAGVRPEEIAAVGITNQRETTVVWERATGRPIHNAIVWQDRRTAEVMRGLRSAGHAEAVRAKTGLVLDPYFSGSKAAWILDQVPGARARAARGELAFGTVDSWVLWKLTGGSAHKTDVSNASRTMLMDLEGQRWEEGLLSLLNVPVEVLPEICGNAEVYGEVRGVEGLADGTPVSGMAGDQQAALFGQACFAAGEAKCTYGTGAFLLMNTGSRPVASGAGLLTTAAWRLNGEATYALEGSAFVAGAAVQWLRDGLRFFSSSAEIEVLAGEVEDNGGVVFVPALTGLGAPHWDPEARGVLWGMTRGDDAGAHRAGGVGGDRAAERGYFAGDGVGPGGAAAVAEGRWRGVGERPLDAAPERPVGLRDRATGDDGHDRAGFGAAGGAGGGALQGPGGDPGLLA